MLTREVVKDHPAVSVVADRADERRAQAERRRRCGGVAGGTTAEDRVREHPHLRVHWNERQHRKVVVRTETEAYIIELFHRDDYTIFI